MNSKADIGAVCYSKAVPGAYGSVIMGRIRDDVKNALGTVLEKALKDAIVRHVGIDLAHPDDEVRDGDRVLVPGGQEEHLPGGAGYSSEDVDNLIEVLGVSIEGLDTSAAGVLAEVVDRASALRVRLGGVMQSLTGDGCNDFAEGVQDLEKWLEKDEVRKLALSILGPQDTDQSLSELLELALAERPYQEILKDLQSRTEESAGIRTALIDFAGRDPGTDLTTEEILHLVLEDHARECERRQAVQDRVQVLLLRLVGECGEGLSTETMLDRIEASLGPVPEF